MAHSSPQSVPEIPGLPQSKTLFISARVKAGVLVTPKGESFTKRKMNFDCAQDALTWCETHGASLVFVNAPDLSGN